MLPPPIFSLHRNVHRSPRTRGNGPNPDWLAATSAATLPVMSTPPPVPSVSHYRLVELLGRGAMGEVWVAEDTQLPRRVAVKLLAPHLLDDREAVERLLRESQAAASVDHPAVVTVYDAGVEAGRPYLVMQKVEGETLEKRLARGPLPVDEAVALAIPLADALSEVHALGIVHRDLKPSNVMLTARGPKILDFGVASVKGSTSLTHTGLSPGTPFTMSPEHLRGLPPDNRSDLWAFGVMLYEALTGRRPFRGESFDALAHAILNEQPPAPSTLRREVRADLDALVMKLLRKDPALRYARAEDVIADLQSCDCAPSSAPPEPARPTAPRLAVMPFEVMSGDADNAFLAAGLTEDLIVDLTRVEGLHVASRAEVQPFRDRNLPPRTLARELGAEYLVLGSVRRAGQRARISAQLVRAGDGQAIWADRFDRTLEDLFDVQAEVSRAIVDALQVTLRPGERDMLDRAPTRSREAYALYLRARELLDKGSRESNYVAVELLERAIGMDPGFALAHAALGEAHVRRVLAWWSGYEAAEQAEAAAAEADRIQPDLVESKVVHALVHRVRGETEAMIRALQQVTAANPTHPEALELTGWSYLAIGRVDDAVKVLEDAVRLHPARFTAPSFLSNAYELQGRQEDALAMQRYCHERLLDTLQRDPGNVHARSLLAGSLVKFGDLENAIAEAEKTLRMAPGDGRARYNAACTFARAGLRERALDELEAAAGTLTSFIADWPLLDPDLASVRDEPRFQRLFVRRRNAVGTD